MEQLLYTYLVDGARVQDLIGLTMFKYTEEARKPKLKVS
jgi:hypothetical protein